MRGLAAPLYPPAVDQSPIAIANYDFRSSGTVLKSIEIAEALTAAGVPAELWVVRDRGALRERVPGTVPVVETGGGLRAKSREADLALNIPGLARAVKHRRPAVLLSGGNHFHVPAKLAMRLSGQRGTVRLGLRASNSSRRPTGAGALTQPGRSDRFKYAGADFIAAVSSELADEVRSLVAKTRVTVIPNGVGVERVRRMAAEPFDHPFFGTPDGPLLVSVGRLTKQKGFDLAVRAIALLPDVRLLIVGAGKDGEADKLRTLAAGLGVEGRVSLMGFQANPFAIMARCDAYVSASRWEGASNALLEALACGLPLVATDAPTGNREILANGRNGTLAPLEDPVGLAHAITTELAMKRDREEQRAAADALDISLCLDRWVSLLSEQRDLARTARSEH